MYERKYHDETEWEPVTRDQIAFAIGGVYDVEMFLAVLDAGDDFQTPAAIYRKRKEGIAQSGE